MNIVLATNSLASFGGSETYLLTIAEQLERLGHRVTISASEFGAPAELAIERGLTVARSPEALPAAPDAVIAQDHPSALTMADRYPSAPRLFVCHSGLLSVSQPPRLAGAAAAVVVMSDFVRTAIESLAGAQQHRIHRLRQPIDIVRFSPRGAIASQPRRALLFGNYLRGPRRDQIASVLERAGIEVAQIGRHGKATARPEEELAQADIVFGYGRSLLEAMACGRAAYVLDHGGGDGWITSESWGRIEAAAFAGRSTPDVIDAARLASDLERYHVSMGTANRDLVVLNHNATRHAWSLVEILRSLGASDVPPAPLEEMSRLVRQAWRAEGLALDLAGELDSNSGSRDQGFGALWARLKGAESALTEARIEVSAARRDAAEARSALESLRSQRRVRLANRLASPLDRARRR